jgi:diguanylate cyclase (GGDEF)-like protein/PAS domain S-box-containing protein
VELEAQPEPDAPGAAPSAPRRIRLSVYAAFVLLAALAVFQAWYAQRLERIRAADAGILHIAGLQGAFAQQMGRIAALAVGDGASQAEVLAGALDRSRTDALALEALLAGQQQLDAEGAAAAQHALTRWQDARERLWYRCEVLLRHLADGETEALPASSAAVQREADPALAAASALTDRLQAQAGQRSATQLRLSVTSMLLTLAVLALLALFAVEPTVRVVTIQLARLRQQSEELERFALVAARTDNVVVLTGPDRTVHWVNDAFVRRTGYTLEEARGGRAGRLLLSACEDVETARRLTRALAAGVGARAELRHRAKDGSEFWLDADFQPLRGADGLLRGWVTVGMDITERLRLQEQLRHSARTDALTGLPNRAVLLERVQRAIEHARRHPGYGFAVMFLDFDRFKQINDTLGHAVGDELLRQIARRIEDTLRPGDAVARVPSELQTAARVGGDEFAVLLEGVRDAESARHIAERLLGVLAEPYPIGAHAVQSSASIGLVTSDGAAAGAEEMLRDADTAMYEAKRSGRGRCLVFDRSMHDRVVQALEIEHDLRRALREDELFVVYQPVVELATGAMAAVEALVRWRHPVLGLMPPGRFIGVAEEAGLIDAIGERVLESACRQFVRWRVELGARAPRQLAVNLSRAQLTIPGFANEVRAVLERHAMAPGELQLEITESLAAQDERVQLALRELKTLGVRLALDDFGTGYSSLACLHQLPVDTVKIDRSFVMHAETVEYHRVLIEATIRVAQTLGMTTVAEGIETAGQAALMEQLRCHRGQGFLFARPLAADELERWARESVAVAAG